MNLDEQTEIFSQNLSFYVEHSGLMQKEIAKRIGISTSTLNTWIKGKSLPNAAKVQTLADFFHIGKSQLLDRHDNEKESLDREASALYNSLDADDQAETRDYMRFKLQSAKYKKDAEAIS